LIDFETFARGVEELRKEVAREDLNEAFVYFDKTKQGVVSFDEIL
jgi:Ca2+-binding EF-hand superfamily protein